MSSRISGPWALAVVLLVTLCAESGATKDSILAETGRPSLEQTRRTTTLAIQGGGDPPLDETERPLRTPKKSKGPALIPPA
jgi:hypothetical protein